MAIDKETNKKITSLANEKKEALQAGFQRKGLSTLLSEVKFTIDPTLRSEAVLKKLISAVKRVIKKQYNSRTKKNRIQFFEEIKIDPVIQVRMEEMTIEKDGLDLFTEVNDIVYECLPSKRRNVLKKTDIQVAKIIVTGEQFTVTGYTSINEEVSQHNIEFRHRRFKAGNKVYYDAVTLLSEIIVMQSLLKYGKDNASDLRNMIVDSYVNEKNELTHKPETRKFSSRKIKKRMLSAGYHIINNEMPRQSLVKKIKRKLTSDQRYKKDFIEYAKSLGIKTDKAKASKYLTDMKNVFYAKEQLLDEKTFRSFYSYGLFRVVVKDFVQDAAFVTYKVLEMLKAKSDYAKSFQTKKHIKVEHKKTMLHNVFLERYGYVEIDNDVLETKFLLIEKDFVEIINTIPVPIARDYSFRIKKLGQHKAEGLFYSNFKTTIFDYRHTTSYIHELGHQIDWMLSKDTGEEWLSETQRFKQLLRLYRKIVAHKVESLPKEHPFRIQWEGKNKYGKMYYFNPKEIFARSFEVYMVVKYPLSSNSLLKGRDKLEESFVHVFDEDYIKLIIELFDGVLATIQKNNEEIIRQDQKVELNKKVITVKRQVKAKKKVEEPVEIVCQPLKRQLEFVF
ncbi:hypothetical protein MZM54_03430 [[Brevibacterium] frigoritolerans]|nr:hypothetical protein [Peribacillus frigoritolerans]